MKKNSTQSMPSQKGRVVSDKVATKPVFTEDKRKTARHEHTNHFTNRAPLGK